MSDRPDPAESIALPDILPIFPLTAVLLLPRGRLIGMVQPSDPAEGGPGIDNRMNPPVYPIGCAGRITQFSETDDGRYLLTLTGVSRFRIKDELPLLSGYRRVVADWRPFA